jgi:hypothetical protein
MTQASFRADSIQVEPGAVGTRLISRSTAGDLLFTDPSNPSGIALTSLAGLRSITSVLMVGLGRSTPQSKMPWMLYLAHQV